MRDFNRLMTGIVLLLLSAWTTNAQPSDIPPLDRDIDVFVELDLNQAFFNGVRPDSVGILGSQAPLGLDIASDLIYLEDPEEDRVWSTAFKMTQGKDADLAFRFAFQVEGKWMKEGLPGNADHLILIDDSESTQRVQMAYVPGKGVAPGLNEKGFVDEYSTVLDLLGEKGNTSPYTYYEAVTKISQGEVPAAEIAYAKYLENQPDAITSDEYPFLFARHLERDGDVEGALEYIQNQEKTALGLERKAQFALRSAEILARTGDLVTARAEFDRVAESYKNQNDAVNEALYRRALTRFQEDSTARGVKELETWLIGADPTPVETPDPNDGILGEKWQRAGLARLGLGYLDLHELEQAQFAYRQLSEYGTPAEQLRSKMQQWEVALVQDAPIQVLAGVGELITPALTDSLLSGQLPSTPDQLALLQAAQRDHLHAGLLFLQARAYQGLERDEDMVQSLERLLKEHPESRYTSYARTLLEKTSI